MKQFINKEDLIYELQNLRINKECYLKITEMISNLPTVGVESVSTKCGTCNCFERYNDTRGYCNKKKEYCDKKDYCENWEDGSK